MEKFDFSTIPSIGWIVILLIAVLIILAILLIAHAVYLLVKTKGIKTKYFEIAAQKEVQRQIYIAEGKDQLDNQSQVAKQLLKRIRIRMYQIGLELFAITDQKENDILELITYRIVDRLNYDVRNDLTRNHITSKTDYELKEYSEAKAKGYYYMIYDRLFTFNSKLPNYDLSKIIDAMPEMDFQKTFKEIYFAARGIACGERKQIKNTEEKNNE